jgi:hypothetical protein
MKPVALTPCGAPSAPAGMQHRGVPKAGSKTSRLHRDRKDLDTFLPCAWRPDPALTAEEAIVAAHSLNGLK